MRIALLAAPRFPIAAPFAGGLERHTHQLATGLRARGHEVTLFGHPESDFGGRVVPVRAGQTAGAVGLMRPLRRAMRQVARERFDLVQDNTIHFLPPVLAAGLNCPVVTTLHTPAYRSHRWAAHWLPRPPHHHFVSISHYLAEAWRPLIGAATVIHNGVDPAGWNFSPAPEERLAVWFGRLVPEKGAELAIRAARAAGWRLVLAGPRHDEAYFRRSVEPLLGDGISYVGPLDQVELSALVGRAAAALMTPVWEEPFGLSYVEALACGTPVVGFRSGAAGEIVTPETGRLVAKGDLAALTQVLAGGLNSQLREACRRRATTDFSLERMIDRYEALYRSLTT